MIRLLPVPGLQTLEQYDVRVFPAVCPAKGRTVYVWDQKGDFLGEYVFRFGRSANGDALYNIRFDHAITRECPLVYWMYPDQEDGPAFEKVSPDQINPGDKIEMFEQWWNVRYINFYAGSRRFQLQREEDELHPLCDKTCMKVEFHDGLHVRIKRMLPARGGRDA